jgi:hypothetical protein
MKTIKISIPNDYNSDEDWAAAVLDCYGDNPEAVDYDINDEAMRERMADCAMAAGLKFVESTDFGAVWRGTAAQIKACRSALPVWAYTD